MIRIYYGAATALPDDWDGLPLSEYRREKLQRLRLESSRRESLGAELLLIHARRRFDPSITIPPEIRTKEGGKPYFPRLPLYFSLSHSGGLAGCALSDREIGLDLQVLCPVREAVLRRSFSQEERNRVEAATDPAWEFTRLWARKESRVKALGTGISTPLNRVSVLEEDYSCWVLALDNAVLALSAPGISDPVPDCVEYCELSGLRESLIRSSR